MTAAAENSGLDFRHDSYLVPWAIRHALWTYTRYAKDEDSSPYFVTHGRNYDGEVAEFGGKVHVYPPPKQRVDKLRPRWKRGLWVGKSEQADQHILLTETGVELARNIKRLDRFAAGMADTVMFAYGIP